MANCISKMNTSKHLFLFYFYFCDVYPVLKENKNCKVSAYNNISVMYSSSQGNSAPHCPGWGPFEQQSTVDPLKISNIAHQPDYNRPYRPAIQDSTIWYHNTPKCSCNLPKWPFNPFLSCVQHIFRWLISVVLRSLSYHTWKQMYN